MNKPAKDMPEWKAYKITYVDGLKTENSILREALEKLMTGPNCFACRVNDGHAGR